jgi:hypothetical protein
MRLMTTGRSHAPPAALLGVAVLSVAGGCATRSKSSRSSTIPTRARRRHAPDWARPTVRVAEAGDAARRIEDVIAPIRIKGAGVGLRVRQGVIYLNQNQYNLAAVARSTPPIRPAFTIGTGR